MSCLNLLFVGRHLRFLGAMLSAVWSYCHSASDGRTLVQRMVADTERMASGTFRGIWQALDPYQKEELWRFARPGGQTRRWRAKAMEAICTAWNLELPVPLTEVGTIINCPISRLTPKELGKAILKIPRLRPAVL